MNKDAEDDHLGGVQIPIRDLPLGTVEESTFPSARPTPKAMWIPTIIEMAPS
jgi:hypothetical protein